MLTAMSEDDMILKRVAKEGFTLTELIVVIGILSFTFLGVLKFFLSSSDFYEYS